MDAVDHCKDPLHNLHTQSGTTQIPNGHDGTHSIIQDGDHPQLRFCSTSCVCMFIGVTIALGSIAMTVCSYFADAIARETNFAGNVTEIVIDEHLRSRIAKFRTIGPILIGLGIFFMLCACVLLCEARDRLNKTSEESEKILPIEYHNGDSYRTADSIKAESLAITPDIEFPIPSSSSPESESSCSVRDDHANMHRYGTYDLPVCGRQGSPVVLVHGVDSIDDTCSKSSQELPVRTDSLKRSKDKEPPTDSSSPTKVLNLQDSPVRKLPKLQLPPPSPPKTPKLLELSPSKLPSANSVFPKPVMIKPIRLPPLIQHGGNGPLINIQPKANTSNQMLQTDFPSPCSSCDPSPVRVPRTKKTLEKHPTDSFLLKNLSPENIELLSTNNSNKEHQRTGEDNQSFSHQENDIFNLSKMRQESPNQNMDVSPLDDMETCMDTPGSDNASSAENQSSLLCNRSPAAANNQGNQNGGSLPESEHDSPLRDTNSNITGSTASVHSRNSNPSPNKALSVNKREAVLV